MSWAWVRAYRVSRRLKKEWTSYLTSVETFEQTMLEMKNNNNNIINNNNTKTIEIQNQLQSTYSKLDVFLKDFIESLNDSVEQYKKSVTEKLSVDSIYGDCQTLLLDLVKASKQIVNNVKTINTKI